MAPALADHFRLLLRTRSGWTMLASRLRRHWPGVAIVTVAVGRLFDLHNSAVTTSVAGGTGSGGNIFINPHLMNPPLMVLDNSRIEANAQRGAGGNITIQAGQLIRTPDSVIRASSELGLSGTISIAAPNTDVVGSLVVLPKTLLDASSQLREACAARGGHPGSSFTAGGRGDLPR
jgi:large exoprotein involved in heme utilization and adhesion